MEILYKKDCLVIRLNGFCCKRCHFDTMIFHVIIFGRFCTQTGHFQITFWSTHILYILFLCLCACVVTSVWSLFITICVSESNVNTTFWMLASDWYTRYMLVAPSTDWYTCSYIYTYYICACITTTHWNITVIVSHSVFIWCNYLVSVLHSLKVAVDHWRFQCQNIAITKLLWCTRLCFLSLPDRCLRCLGPSKN